MDNRQHLVVEEVMEHQSVTIGSNGVYTEMRANTTIISAINPLRGSYDWSLNVWQNTNLRKSLLSKFDLILILVDTPDEQMDSKLSKDILNSKKCLETIKNESKPILTSFDRNDSQLMAKLRFSAEEEEPDLIPHELLKHYIRYAQTYVNPVLNEEAMDLLEEFCSEFESTVISRSQTQDIETLYRLTEARARVEMRPEATKEDVFDVIDIIRHSVGKHFMTPNVVHSIQTLLSLRNSKKSQNTKNLLKALKMISENTGQKEFSFAQIVDICHKFEIPFDSREQISDSIERLNLENFLLKTNSNYKLID